MLNSNNNIKMHIELTVGLNFILSYLYNKIPRRRVSMFGEELEKCLKLKYTNHWHTDKPYKESGYRCIKVSSDNVDLTLIKAANDSGMELQEILKILPQNLTIWIDPGEVTCRLNERGLVKILYEDDLRSKMRYKKYDSLQKNLNFRLHHHHHRHTQTGDGYDGDDDDCVDLNQDNDECTCYCDDTTINFNDLLLQDELNNNNSNNIEQSSSPQLQPLQHKPLSQLMNSHSSTSLANSKIYKTSVFNSTHNINLAQAAAAVQQQQQQQQQQQLPQPPLSTPQQHNPLLQLQQQQSQLSKSNMQRLLTTSIDSFSSLSFNDNTNGLGGLSIGNGFGLGGNALSLWSLPSISSDNSLNLLNNENNNNNNNNSNTPTSSITLPTPIHPPAPSTPTSSTSTLSTTPSSSVQSLKTPVPSTSTATANQLFTTASFAQTKFGSTKTKTINKKQQKMLPSEFSAYIKQKAQMQHLQKNVVGLNTPIVNGVGLSVRTPPTGTLTKQISPPSRPLSQINTNDLFNFDFTQLQQQYGGVGDLGQKINFLTNPSPSTTTSSSTDSSSVGSSFLSDSPPPPSLSTTPFSQQQQQHQKPSLLIKTKGNVTPAQSQLHLSSNSLVSGFANLTSFQQQQNNNKQDFSLLRSNSSTTNNGFLQTTPSLSTSNLFRPSSLTLNTPLQQFLQPDLESPTSNYFNDFNNNTDLNDYTDDLLLYQSLPTSLLSTATPASMFASMPNQQQQQQQQSQMMQQTPMQTANNGNGVQTATNNNQTGQESNKNGSSFKNQLLMAN